VIDPAPTYLSPCHSSCICATRCSHLPFYIHISQSPWLTITSEQAAEAVKQAVPETTGEAKGQANEVAGQAKGKANELAGQAKGKAAELQGEANKKL
jgi:hypothetical protein